MSTPPEQSSRPAYGYTGGTLDIARLPIPGNAEFGVYVIVLVVLALMAKFDDHVSGGDFVHATTWVTAAYLISRGLAKASRVLEQ